MSSLSQSIVVCIARQIDAVEVEAVVQPGITAVSPCLLAMLTLAIGKAKAGYYF